MGRAHRAGQIMTSTTLHSSPLCYALLRHTMLYYAILRYTALYCAVYCAVLRYTALYCMLYTSSRVHHAGHRFDL